MRARRNTPVVVLNSPVVSSSPTRGGREWGTSKGVTGVRDQGRRGSSSWITMSSCLCSFPQPHQWNNTIASHSYRLQGAVPASWWHTRRIYWPCPHIDHWPEEVRSIAKSCCTKTILRRACCYRHRITCYSSITCSSAAGPEATQVRHPSRRAQRGLS